MSTSNAALRPRVPSPRRVGQVFADNRRFEILETTYDSNARRAFLIEEGHARYSRLSVNVPDIDLRSDEFLAKTFEENELLRSALLECGLFYDTGIRAPVGYYEYEIWTYREPAVTA